MCSTLLFQDFFTTKLNSGLVKDKIKNLCVERIDDKFPDFYNQKNYCYSHTQKINIVKNRIKRFSNQNLVKILFLEQTKFLNFKVEFSIKKRKKNIVNDFSISKYNIL